jgi:hypothetical protein
MGILVQWVLIIGIFVAIALIYNRYQNLVRHEDEKVDEVWKKLKEKYLNPIEILSDELPEKEIDKTLKGVESDHPTQKQINKLEEILNKELESVEKQYGKAFRKKLDQKYSDYEIAKFER